MERNRGIKSGRGGEDGGREDGGREDGGREDGGREDGGETERGGARDGCMNGVMAMNRWMDGVVDIEVERGVILRMDDLRRST